MRRADTSMRSSSLMSGALVWVLRGMWVMLSLAAMSHAQAGATRTQPFAISSEPRQQTDGSLDEDRRAEGELQTGTGLTRRGLFTDAIPHLLAARGHVANEYAAAFNLALCYVGTREYAKAIAVLDALRKGGHANPEVENLLAQSYVGLGQPQPALAALERAASLTPANEKLYLLVGDSCMDSHDYSLGRKVVTLGLKNLPNSARLHYQKAMFLSLLDEFDDARNDFAEAQRLSPGSEIAYLAAASEAMYAGNPMEAARQAREGIRKGYENTNLLSILGDALVRAGARPGEPTFAEAQAHLEKAVGEQPDRADAQLALGKLYLLANRTADAIAHLEKAREMEPASPSVYANLAKAYQRHGDLRQAQDALAALAKLNREQAEKIGSAPGDRRLSYTGSSAPQ